MTETVEKKQLTWRQRRDMGLTLPNCIRVAKKLKKSGKLSDDPDVASGQIAAELAGENPKAFGDPGVDWDAILAFIEALLPLILQIISMFSAI